MKASPQISDLYHLGAHFIRLDDDKRPIGYKSCECPNLARVTQKGLKGHLPLCRSWLAHRLSGLQADQWEGLIGIIPGSIGLMAVDIDGVDHKAPSPSELIGARIAWQSHLGAPPVGFQQTRSGGRHDLYRTSNADKVGNLAWKIEYQGDRVCGGEVRGSRGYIVVWDIDALHEAAFSEDRVIAWPKWSVNALSRYAAAAALPRFKDGGRHEHMIAGIASDVSTGALTSPDAWYLAAELSGFDRALQDGGKEIRQAWDSAVRKYGQGEWEGGRERSASIITTCPLPHGDAGASIEQAVDLLRDRLRYIDDRFKMTSGVIPVWRNAGRAQQKGHLQAAGICSKCIRDIGEAILNEIEHQGDEVRSVRSVTFLQDGKVVKVGKGHGLARLQEARFDDLLRWRPRIDLSGPGWDDDEPMLVGAMRTIWGLGEHEVDWLRRWLSRSLDAPQRRGPFILGRSGIGKSLFQAVMMHGMPYGSVEVMSGKRVDRYASEDLMKAIFVFMDDAQNIGDDGWDMAQSTSGGMPGRVRAMQKSDPTMLSESSLAVMGEGAYMEFDRRFRRGTGWDNRVAYLLALGDRPTGQGPWARMISSEEEVRRMMRWMLAGDNDDIDIATTADTARMQDWRGLVHHAAEQSKGAVVMDVDGALVTGEYDT